MRVEPELVDHPKYLRLKKRVGDFALEAVLRLWGHCQNSQRGGTWRNADEEYVEVVCRWTGENGLLYTALRDLKFIDDHAGCLVIHDWDKFNSMARASWRNGATGGRPKVIPAEAIQSPAKPSGNPRETHREPLGTGSQSVSESVSQLVIPGGNNKSGLALVASKTQFAALSARIAGLEKQGNDLDRDERKELTVLKRQLRELQKKQSNGTFE